MSDPENARGQDRTEGARKPSLAVAWIIATYAVIVRLLILRATHSTVEDALITLRYAENLAHGYGFVYNPGEHVLGTTTPLFTLLLALPAALGLDALAFGKAVCILADGATCVLIARLLTALGRPKAGWLAALLYATASAPINFSIGGMETAPVTLAGLIAIYGYVTRRALMMTLALAFLFLLRIDGLLLAAVLLAGWGLRERRFPVRQVALALPVVLPWLVFATFYFGSPVPTSAIAKLIVYQRLRTQTLPNLEVLLSQFAGDAVHAVMLLVSLVGAFVAWRDCRSLRAPLVWLGLYYAAILASKATVQAFGWYFVPPLPVYTMATALGAGSLGRWVVGSLGRWASISSFPHLLKSPALPLALLLLLAIPLTWNLQKTAWFIAQAQQREDTLRKPLGQWLARNSPPGARVMLEPIGYIGYYSQRPVLDIIGLVSPEVFASYRRPDVAFPLADIVVRLRPDLLLLRGKDRAQIEAADRATGRRLLDGEYRFVRAFPEERPVFYLYRRTTL